MSLTTLWKQSLHQRHWHSWSASNLGYLIYTANKHGVDPYELLNSLYETREKLTVTCAPLTISLRKRTEDHSIFLLEKDSKVVAQIRMRNIMWETPAKIKRVYSILVQHSQSIKKPQSLALSIIEVHAGMRNVDLKGKISEKTEMMQGHSRSGNPVRFCVATVTDTSGSIRLPLWSNQIDLVSVGDEIEVKNASAIMLQGLLHIVPSKKKGGLIIVKASKSSQTFQPSTKEEHPPIVPSD